LVLRILVRIQVSEFVTSTRGMSRFHMEMKESARMPLCCLVLMGMQERRFQEGEY
jgi:hypothetical protein